MADSSIYVIHNTATGCARGTGASSIIALHKWSSIAGSSLEKWTAPLWSARNRGTLRSLVNERVREMLEAGNLEFARGLERVELETRT